MKVLLATGGTGGHVFPALALGEALIEQGHSVLLVGDQRAFSFYKNEGAVKAKYISIISPSKGLFKFFLSLLKTLPITYKLMKTFRPDILVGFGGYPTLPFLLINTTIFRKSLLLHEANSTLGKINKFFKPFSVLVTFGLPPSSSKVKNICFTGNPIRKDIKQCEYPSMEKEKNILIFAGSQGASLFSTVIPEAINLIKGQIKNIKIYQQCRSEQIINLENYYKIHNIEAEIQPFFDDLPEKMKIAHLIICRAGALTISEINTINRQAIYIPYPYSSQNHQIYNAQIATNNTDSIMLLEKDLTPIILSDHILSLLTKNEFGIFKRVKNKLSCEQSTLKIINIIDKILSGE